jgi:SAM-dependent methyltransferase
VVHFRSFLHHAQGLRALDAGCGAGRNAAYLAGEGLAVTAVDVSPAHAQQAAQHAGVAGVAAVIERLPFRDGSFDVALCTSVLEYLDSGRAAQAAAELQRVLRPGGRLLAVAAAQEGSEPGYGAETAAAPGTVARLTSRRDLSGWFGGCATIELLHLQLEEPATAPVRAQWALIARRA